MKRVKNFIYFKSNSLNMIYAIHKSGNLMTEDKVFYSKKELSILIKNNIEITKAIHNVKKIFKGEII